MKRDECIHDKYNHNPGSQAARDGMYQLRSGHHNKENDVQGPHQDKREPRLAVGDIDQFIPLIHGVVERAITFPGVQRTTVVLEALQRFFPELALSIFAGRRLRGFWTVRRFLLQCSPAYTTLYNWVHYTYVLGFHKLHLILRTHSCWKKLATNFTNYTKHFVKFVEFVASL